MLVQNQTGRASNKWDKSGVIVECKPHNQVNVMMDGSRRVSLRNRQFVRKIEVPMPVSGVRPSQFLRNQSHGVDDVQPRRDEDIGDSGVGKVNHGERDQIVESTERADATAHDGGLLIDGQVVGHVGVEVNDGGGHVADIPVDQPPVVKSKRIRKPNSKYDPEVFDLDSLEIRRIPLSGKRNGWKGIFWPK